MKKLMVGALVVSVAVFAGASALASGVPSHAGSAALIQRVTVSATEFKYVVNPKTAKRGIVIFKVTNIGKLKHDFEISRRKTPLLSHGQSATLRVVFLRKGHYSYKCTVPGHAAAGMVGVFTIT